MGHTDEIMMSTRTFYAPLTRGHKPTPSQESNTLSEVSCTTTVSMDSGPLKHSATYREEEENRLGDFRDEESGSQDDLSLNGDLSSLNSELNSPPSGDEQRMSSPNVSSRLVRPTLKQSNSNLSEQSSVSGHGSHGFRDSCDTVVRVCVTPCGKGCVHHTIVTHNGPKSSAENMIGMNRDSKSANSDYGSFCATPPVGEGGGASVPLAAGKPGPPYHALRQNGPELADNSLISGEMYQRAPLLTDSEAEDEADGAERQQERGVEAKPALPIPPVVEEKIPSEPLKTLLSGLFLASGFVATTTSLAVTHESVPETDPLPDIILDNVSYQQWGLDVSEILIMVSTFSAFLVVMLHFHRLIILRRVWFLLGCLYYYRALTMFITVLPKADPSYTCKPKLDNTTALPALVIFKRILTLMSGMGLSINGKHIYCGDYIFSGHTMVLTMGYLVIKEYSPRRFIVLHWASFFVSLTGIIMLLIARGHYSIDCILAYYVTTRMWWIYHTLAHNNILKTRGAHNFLDQMWWWLIFRYFENKITAPLPRKYSIPLPRRVKNYLKSCFRRRNQENTAEP